MAGPGQNQDGHQFHTSTAGLTAPVRQFILGVATNPVVLPQNDTIAMPNGNVASKRRADDRLRPCPLESGEPELVIDKRTHLLWVLQPKG